MKLSVKLFWPAHCNVSVRIILICKELLRGQSILVVAQSISEIPEGLMNNPVYISIFHITFYASKVV